MTLNSHTQTPPRASFDHAFVAVSAAVFLALCVLFWPFVADDAYIVGRYAMNAADGNGLVYNIGERVSALTSPLHALLETLFAFAGFDPVDSYRVIAPLFVLAGWLIAVRRTGLRGPALVFFTAMSLFSPFVVLWTVGGLETAMLVFLATVFVSRLVVLCRTGVALSRDFIWLGLLVALMFLTRYDSLFVTAPILLAILAVEFRRAALWYGAAVCFMVAASWLGFAALYYGDVFPTSYYVKFALGGRPPIDSLSALLNFTLVSGLVFVVFLVRPAPMATRTPLSRAILRGGAIGAIIFLLYASRASGQHMMFGYRLFVPYLMGAALIITVSLGHPRVSIAGLAVLWQAVMVAVVAFIGVNPAPLTRLPVLGQAYAEYELITPAAYGAFMDILEADAAAITDDWHSRGLDGQPSIYLRTGGTGYWLPDFYVYEMLISYRQDCPDEPFRNVAASNYMQQLDFRQSASLVVEWGRIRPDIADDAGLMFATTLEWYGPQVIGYLLGASPRALTLSPQVTGCSTTP
mgnify:CR=1 FL=1